MAYDTVDLCDLRNKDRESLLVTNNKASPLNTGKQPKLFYGYIIVLATFLILMIVWGALYSFGVFLKPMLTELGWTRAQISGAYSLNTILVGALSIITGRLSDRFGPRLIASICGFLIGLGYLLMSQIGAIWQIYLLYGVLISIGMAGMLVPLLSTVARWFIKRRGMAVGIAVAGIGFGTLFMPPLANQLISIYSWRISYIIIGVAILLLTVIFAQFLRRDPGQMGLPAYNTDSASRDSHDLEIQGLSLREAFRSRQLWIINAIFFCTIFCVQSIIVHIVAHATDIGISPAAAATILSVVGIVSIGSKIGMGSIGDRIGGKRVMVIVLVLISLFFLWLMGSDELWMLYIFAVAFGITYGGSSAIASPLLVEFFGLRAHGAIFGLNVFTGNTGGAIGALVAGYIFDISGSYFYAFVLCAILGIAGLILSLFLKSTRKQDSSW